MYKVIYLHTDSSKISQNLDSYKSENNFELSE